MKLDDVLGGFDLDTVLRDVSCDAVRRAIAALCIGVGIDDAWLSVRELREAVSLVHEGADGGRARLATILSTACDDFQRAIYYCLAGRGVGNGDVKASRAGFPLPWANAPEVWQVGIRQAEKGLASDEGAPPG